MRFTTLERRVTLENLLHARFIHRTLMPVECLDSLSWFERLRLGCIRRLLVRCLGAELGLMNRALSARDLLTLVQSSRRIISAGYTVEHMELEFPVGFSSTTSLH